MPSRTLRLVIYNTLFGGRDDFGLGHDTRWTPAVPFLKSLEGDMYALEECNFWDLLGHQRLHQARNDLALSTAFLAEANSTTTGHRFHTAMLFNHRWNVIGDGAERAKYHHVLGWAKARLDNQPAVWDFRHLHLSPFSPAHRALEVEPLQTLAAPGRLSVLLGDANTLGIGHPEPDWSPLPPAWLRTHRVRDENGTWVTDRTAMTVLADAGFVDAAHHLDDHRPTAGLADSDVPRRQDLFLLSPTLVPAIVSYEVHTEPLDEGWSDHAAVTVTLDPDRIEAEEGVR
ncbi:hypothetical protein ACWDCB_08485 [Streptomyces sp. NPDC001178]